MLVKSAVMYSTCQQYAGVIVGDPGQSLVAVEVEAVDGVVCDPSVGGGGRSPAHQDGGGANVLIGHAHHRARG